MAIEIKSIKGYYYLDAWVMSHIIHQATISFCQRYLNKDNDPRGRLYDQMVMAARSAPAMTIPTAKALAKPDSVAELFILAWHL